MTLTIGAQIAQDVHAYAALPLGTGIAMQPDRLTDYVKREDGWQSVPNPTAHRYQDHAFALATWYVTALPESVASDTVDVPLTLQADPEPTPELFSGGWTREQMIVAHFVWNHVLRRHHTAYYVRLSDHGVMPSRALVDEFDATLSEGDLGNWFRELAEAANELSFCGVYDEMSNELGLPDREDLGVPLERDYVVDGYATITVRVPISTGITARNADAALESAGYSDPDIDIYAIREAIDNGSYSIDDHEWEDVEES